jgi:hypothetical protein
MKPLEVCPTSGGQFKPGAIQDAKLASHETLLRDLTDSQYKLINETILALLSTTNPEKLVFLRNAVSNSLTATDLKSHEAIYLARIIRDISAEEAAFLISNSSYQRLQFGYANVGFP